MTVLDSSYFKNLLKNNTASKKQVAVYLDDFKLERIDMINKVFSSISGSKSFTRNMLIEEAIDKYIAESEKFLRDEHDIDLDTLIDKARLGKYDTVILSSSGRGFEETFLGENEHMCWYPCKISTDKESNLKYIAIYRGEPISAITHYAVIREFKYSSEKDCKVCYFDGEPKELPNQITLGSKNNAFFRGAKYTKIENLLNAVKADDISFA